MGPKNSCFVWKSLFSLWIKLWLHCQVFVLVWSINSFWSISQKTSIFILCHSASEVTISWFKDVSMCIRLQMLVMNHVSLTSHLVSSSLGRISACSFLKSKHFFSSSSLWASSSVISSCSRRLSCCRRAICVCRACCVRWARRVTCCSRPA